MKRVSILDVLFWVLFIIGILLLLWKIFGDSPTDLQIVAPFIGMSFLKIWNLSDKLIKLEMRTKHSFEIMKMDMDLIKERLKIGGRW